MSSIRKIAQVAPATVAPSATVLAAVEAMAKARVGAVAIVEGGKLKGLFSERDLMIRVVLRRLDPATTKVGDVCTSNLITVTRETNDSLALRQMVERHIRHLPVVDGNGGLIGMLSLRNLLQHRVEDLTAQLHSLENYLGVDGPGG